MKFLRIAIVLAFIAGLYQIPGIAQPKSVGGVFSFAGLEVSYQHLKTSTTFFEFNAVADIGSVVQGEASVPGAKLIFTYNFMFWKKDCSSGSVGAYAGVGAAAGLAIQDDTGRDLVAGLCGKIGLEYSFKVPVILSVDFTPILGMQMDITDGGGSLDAYMKGVTRAYFPRVGIRYCF